MNALSLIDEMIRLLAPRVEGEETNATYLRLMPGDAWFLENRVNLEYLGGRFGDHCLRPSGDMRGRLKRVVSDCGKPQWRGVVWELEGESAIEGLYFARAMYEVLFDALPGFLRVPQKEVLKFAFEAMHWPHSRFISYAKYVTVWPMARYMKQADMPPVPEGFGDNPLVFVGRCKRILRNRLISRSHRNLCLFSGILQGVKRGAYPASDTFIHSTMLKHKSALTANSPMSDTASDQLDLLSSKIFRGLRSKARLYEASTSASFESKRSEGGGREFLRDSPDLYCTDLMRMVEVSPGNVREMRGISRFPTFLDALKGAELAENRVVVSPILEPLKVRLITKGSAIRQWVSRFFQKDLWQHLFKYPQFRLIGCPLDASHLEEILMQEERLGLDEEFDQWVSGDYSAATDGLKLDATKLFFEEAIRTQTFGLDPIDAFRVSEVLRSVLYEQEISYPKIFKALGGLETCQQTNGQLMGSVLSFPILCAINVACYWNSLLKYLCVAGPPQYRGEPVADLIQRVPLELLPVKVNGDDILFRSNDVHYMYWKREVAEVGFMLSLGKNYIHKSILTVNSQVYEYNQENRTFRKAEYLNAGLLTGQSKVTGRETAKAAPIWDLYNEVVAGAAQPERAHRRFVHYHLSAIKEITRGGLMNLASPHLLGGWGFDIPPSALKVTRRQAALGRFLREKAVARLDEGELPEVHNGLRIDTPSVGLKLQRRVRLLRWPRMTPAMAGMREIRDRCVRVRPLECPGYVVTNDDVAYKILPGRVLNEFQKSIWDTRSSRLPKWDYTIWERYTPLSCNEADSDSPGLLENSDDRATS